MACVICALEQHECVECGKALPDNTQHLFTWSQKYLVTLCREHLPLFRTCHRCGETAVICVRAFDPDVGAVKQVYACDWHHPHLSHANGAKVNGVETTYIYAKLKPRF